MRNTALIALLLVAGIGPASAGSTSQEKVTVPRQPTQEAVDAQNNASRETNKLRVRAFVGSFPPPPPGPPPGGPPTP